MEAFEEVASWLRTVGLHFFPDSYGSEEDKLNETTRNYLQAFRDSYGRHVTNVSIGLLVWGDGNESVRMLQAILAIHCTSVFVCMGYLLAVA